MPTGNFARSMGMVLAGIGLLAMTACAPVSRGGMVLDRSTGLQYGSVIERSIFIDASQFPNRRIKVSTRNTSGDLAFDINRFADSLKSSYASKGFIPDNGDGFGVKLDVNVIYSGQVQSNLSGEFAFLGAAAGGIAGAQASTTGAAVGILVGATLGTIIGSYVTEDTYIIVAEVNLGITEPGAGKSKKTITFGSSPSLEEEEQTGFKPFRSVLRTRIAVYAGGRSIGQSVVADEVRRRLIRIVSDII